VVGARAVHLIDEALAAHGPLTRAEVAAILAPHGIPTAGQATIHLLGRAALEGVICLGPLRGRQLTYVLIDDWIGRGRPLAREAALAELTRRYLAAFGPATPEDLAAWSGLPLRDVRAGWQQVAGALLAVSSEGRPAWLLAERADWLADSPGTSPEVRLLPRYDTYLLGYRSREWVVAPAFARRIHPGGGIIHPALLVDGRACGTWASTRRRTNLEIAVEPFEPLPPAVVAGLEVEVASIGHFLGQPAVLRLGPPPA
jgi:hypothetical protein